jgi:Flp pilus assembly pilin Flp
MRSTTCTTTGRLSSAAQAWWKDEEGTTAIEYALVASLVAIGAIAGFSAFGGALSDLYDFIKQKVVVVL